MCVCMVACAGIHQCHRLQAVLEIYPDVQEPDSKFERRCKAGVSDSSSLSRSTKQKNNKHMCTSKPTEIFV